MSYFVSDWPSDWPRASDWPGAQRSAARRIRRGGGGRKWHDLLGRSSSEMGAQLRSPSRKIAPAILPTDADDFEEQLRLIRREYACKLPGKVSALAACLAEREKNLRVLAEARELAHRLKGTAGTYGFNGVAELAARLERSLSALVDDRAGGATLILKEIDELLAELRALAELEFENELASDPTNRPR